MRFVLEIQFGNDAMQTDEDLSAALHQVADDIIGYNLTKPRAFLGMVIQIRDVNGNRVGQRSFKK
jgi:hypothetical protein